MNHKVSFERATEYKDKISSFAVFVSSGAIAVFDALADAEDFARYIATDHRHTRTIVAEMKLDIRSEVVSGEIAENSTFITRAIATKAGGPTVFHPERMPDGRWSHVWPPMPAANAWGQV